MNKLPVTLKEREISVPVSWNCFKYGLRAIRRSDKGGDLPGVLFEYEAELIPPWFQSQWYSDGLELSADT